MANVRSCLNSKGSDLSRWNGKILILEASKESRRIGNHTNVVYEFLMISGPLKRLQLRHPEITIELAHCSGSPKWIDMGCEAIRR